MVLYLQVNLLLSLSVSLSLSNFPFSYIAITRCVLISLGVAAGMITICLSLSKIDEDEAHERWSERSRLILGLVYGLFLKCSLSFGAFSESPLLLNVACQAVFGALTAGALILLLYHEVKVNENERLTDTEDLIEVAGFNELDYFDEVDMEAEAFDEVVLDAEGHEYWLWIPVGASYGSMLMVVVWIFFNLGMANPWSGNGLPYPVVHAPLVVLLVGTVAARFLSETIYWVVLFIIGGALFLHTATGGAVAGLCLIALAGPSGLLAVLNMLSRGYTAPAMVLGHIFTFLFLIFYLGIDVGSYSLIGGSFIGAPFKLGWILISLSSVLCILVLILRAIFSEDAATLGSRLFLPKLHRPNVRALLSLAAVFLVVFITAIIIRGAVAGRPNRDAIANDEFRVMTYNVFLGFNVRTGRSSLHQISELINDYGVDIVAMQETDSWDGYSRGSSVPEYCQHLLSFATVNYGAPSNIGTFNQATLSTFPMTEVGWKDLPADTLCDTCLNRVLVHQDVQVSGALVVRIVNVHLSAFDEASRILQAEEARSYAELYNGPIIILGDFNDGPNSTVYDIFAQNGYSDAVFEASGTTSPETYYKCWNGVCESATIDFVFYKGLTILDAQVLDDARGISDHFPVIATFSR